MKKRQIANLIMAVIILASAAAGFWFVGSVRGWFGTSAENAVLSETKGIVNLEREGIAYPVEAGTILRTGDKLTCGPGATAGIETGEGHLTLGGNAEIIITEPSGREFAADVVSGEVFVHSPAKAGLAFDGKEIKVEDAVAMLSVRAGAQTVYVFAGAVGGANAGQTLDWVGTEQTVGNLQMESLNDFAISQIRAANGSAVLCIANADLDQLIADRSSAIQSQLTPGNPDGRTCTIAICCDTILDNWDDLDPAKGAYVPEDGVILAPVTVEFTEGETVFDVLQRVCEIYGIQIEYSWTPLYDSYYIEGIHHLYEFDCGFQSGWVYKVNEWFPNYGCSAYKLTGGESIVWSYTCNGYGEDVGAEGWE